LLPVTKMNGVWQNGTARYAGVIDSAVNLASWCRLQISRI
jgi:hypothetical protein